MPYFTNWHKKLKKTEYQITVSKLESVQCVRDLGIKIASSLTYFQQCKDAAGKANRMLDFINKTSPSRNNSTTVYHLSHAPSGICRVILVASPCKGCNKIRSRPAKGYEDYVLVL